jgi:FKBP-type peptidyl-prolyl cis-trans isomerase SlyD
VKITRGAFVSLTYRIRNQDGEVVESSDEDGPMAYLHGYAEVPAGLEEALDGKQAGDDVIVTLPPGEAYGDYNPDGILPVARDQFPEDAEIVPGDVIPVQIQQEDDDPEAEGEMIDMRVLEISPEAIVLDANHPLAGQEVTFDVRVVAVRPATPDEIEERSEPEEAPEP